jgi:hypothetical protein
MIEIDAIFGQLPRGTLDEKEATVSQCPDALCQVRSHIGRRQRAECPRD